MHRLAPIVLLFITSGGNQPLVNLGGAGTAATSVGSFGSSPNTAGLSLSANVLRMQPADGTHPGGVSTGTQSIAGQKTFDGGSSGGTLVVGNAGGGSLIRLTLSGGSSSLYFSGGSDSILFHPNGTQSFIFQDANSGDNYILFDSTNKAVTIPRNVGFTFPTALAPSGTTQTVDWSTGSSQTVDASSTTGTLVLTFSNPVSGGRYELKTIGKTGRLWTFPTAKWASGTPPTVTATNGAIDVYNFIYDGTNYIGSIFVQNAS